MIRYINCNPTMQQSREGASALSGGIGMMGHAFQHEGKGNSATAEGASAKDLLAPIEENLIKPKKKRKTG